MIGEDNRASIVHECMGKWESFVIYTRMKWDATKERWDSKYVIIGKILIIYVLL